MGTSSLCCRGKGSHLCSRRATRQAPTMTRMPLIRRHLCSKRLSQEDHAAGHRWGQIQLVRSHPDWMQPFQSVTEIRCWMPSSMNQQSMLGWRSAGRWCRLLLGTYYVERLPDASEETLQRVEENLKGLKNDSLSTLFRSGLTAPDLVDRILEGVGVMHGTYSTGAPSYKCSCSPERFLYRLKALPRPELEQIILKQEILEMTCAFCGEVYHISWDRVRKLLDISEQENEISWREEAPQAFAVVRGVVSDSLFAAACIAQQREGGAGGWCG
mmetsp:Transcript_33784/g.97404  ORF Transcript_33784/g.97404 Transcript_33784/m.97404 type:complete len:271 (-) Transcript_33784:195-1007(-)